MNVKLLVVHGRPAGKCLTFPPGEYYFGRGVECHVRPNSDWVSRQHCLLRVAAEGAFLRDLASRNGTLVNGALLHREQRLYDRDQIQLGPLVFEVRLEEPAAGRPVARPAPTTVDPQSSAEIPVAARLAAPERRASPSDSTDQFPAFRPEP